MVTTAGSASNSTRTRRGGFLGGVEGLGRDGCDGLAVVLRLADGDDRPVSELRAESGHRLGQVGGGDDEADAGDRERGARVDRVDPGAGDIEGDELDVERVARGGCRRRRPGARSRDQPADARRRVADAPGPSSAGRSASSGSARRASSTASMICS